MAKYKPWLKMWVEWIDDLKMLDLTLAEQGAWWRLVTLAKKCAADGPLVKDNGAPLSLDEIASTLRIITKADRKVFDAMIEKMTDQGSLHWNHNTLIITHFKDRQARTTSKTPEAVRDRVRRFRERQRPTPPSDSKEKESSKEKETIELEAEADNSLQKTLHSNVKSVTSEPALAKIATLHEQFFGLITPTLSEKFKDFLDHYRGPVEWIDLAFDEAVKYKNRRWQYVEAILYSWQEKGGPHADRREPGDEGERLGAHQRDIIAEARAAGWEVQGDDEPETTEAGNQN